MRGLFPVKVVIARAAGELSRRAGRGGGTTLPGKLLVRLEPDAVRLLAAGLPDGAALISATNGKTTTTAMAAAILEGDAPIVRNIGGANLVSGIASALLRAHPGARRALLEVDEAALPAVAAATRPGALLLGNLFRDQLDRYGELDLIAARWREVVRDLPASSRLVVNADDPLVASLAAGRDGVVTYGLDDPAVGGPLDHASDSTSCTRCGATLAYASAWVGHVGDWSCPACGLARPSLDIRAVAIELDGTAGSRFRVVGPDGEVDVTLSVPGLYNVQNAVGALALAHALGIPLDVAAPRLTAFRGAFGRFERLPVGDRTATLLLVKNPAGANVALRAIAQALDGRPVLLALNDRIADGRDVSWIWDVEWEPVLPAAGHVVCSGTRAADIALRALYAGVPRDRIEVVDVLADAFDRVCELAGSGGEAYVLPTYTAMLDLQALARERGLAGRYWEEQATAGAPA